MSAFSAYQKIIQENDVKFVDLRFTDTNGIWHHVSFDANQIAEEHEKIGIAFDGSSIPGWKTIDKSDTLLIPDFSTARLDAFSAQPQVIVICDIADPGDDEVVPYSRCPRQIALAAEDYLNKSGMGDTAFFGPEAEFFIFDSVRISSSPQFMAYRIDSEDMPASSYTKMEQGNSGHRPAVKGGYFPCPPVDSAHDLRAEMLSTLQQMGVKGEKHHHEVGSAQQELGHKFNTLIAAADDLQTYKYVVRNVAHSYGKTATFMPKPVLGDNGSGMHVHISIWKEGKNLFHGDGYANLSQEALYFIGGILHHGRSINAFANPSTNSFKRLVPGYEAPTLLAYSAHNRSASCRIPHSTSPQTRRIELRFPDPMANPYLLFTSLLMAGLDGIQNKIDPGASRDEDLYHLPEDQLAKIPSLCRTLREALAALENDHEFLTRGNVMTKEFVQSFINLRKEEIARLEQTPHPVEFELYYSR